METIADVARGTVIACCDSKCDVPMGSSVAPAFASFAILAAFGVPPAPSLLRRVGRGCLDDANAARAPRLLFALARRPRPGSHRRRAPAAAAGRGSLARATHPCLSPSSSRGVPLDDHLLDDLAAAFAGPRPANPGVQGASVPSAGGAAAPEPHSQLGRRPRLDLRQPSAFFRPADLDPPWPGPRSPTQSRHVRPRTGTTTRLPPARHRRSRPRPSWQWRASSFCPP